jgi:hypothetical protein
MEKYLLSQRSCVIKNPIPENFTVSQTHYCKVHDKQEGIPGTPGQSGVRAKLTPHKPRNGNIYQIPEQEEELPHSEDIDWLPKLPSEATMFKPQYVHMLQKAQFGEVEMKKKEIVIPPLNTDIRFSKTLPRFKKDFHFIKEKYGPMTISATTGRLYGGIGESEEEAAGSEKHVRGELHEHSHHHENFSWTIPTDHDNRKSFRKKQLIHPVFNQQGCGSCWACSFTTTMSDCLVVAGVVDWAPNISTTFAMACYPQGRCAGGIPADLAKEVELTGCADESCMDYNWCVDNQNCNTEDASTHFNIDPVDLSKEVPNCGCDISADAFYYYLDTGTDMISINEEWPMEDFRQMVKYHILDFGPVIGGYIVLKNFLSGAFTQSNQGVYFDRADYNNMAPGKPLYFSDTVSDYNNSAGLHAVSIVGWGVAKNVQYDNDKFGDVPFWYCRNSWGTGWGDSGFFKIAMYPFNTLAQFDKEVDISVGVESAKIGGFILIRATNPPEIRNP